MPRRKVPYNKMNYFVKTRKWAPFWKTVTDSSGAKIRVKNVREKVLEEYKKLKESEANK